MQQWWTGDMRSFSVGSVVLGVMLILIGVLLFVMPELLAYVIASIFVLAGAGLIASAWRVRQNVTFRRVDQSGDPFQRPF